MEVSQTTQALGISNDGVKELIVVLCKTLQRLYRCDQLKDVHQAKNNAKNFH